MAATYDTDHLRARAQRRLVDFDPDATTAVVVTLNPAATEKALSVALNRRWLFGIMRSVGTGTVTAARIIACTSAAGTGSVTTVVAHAIGTAPDAVGDTIWLECDAEQVREALPTATHVGLEITLATSTDECVVYVEAAAFQYPRAGLTADYIS